MAHPDMRSTFFKDIAVVVLVLVVIVFIFLKANGFI